ncbi:MAG: ATP-binding protein [Actinomycetia bacterium]|nr:ATP-binding protein [Actinomycetes bacterium]
MDVSPFPFFGPLEPDQVEGRTELIADLTERVTARRVTAVLGPRRYGKTSVLGRVAADLERSGASTLWFDLYEVSSMADLAIRLDDGMKRARPALAETLASITASISLDVGFVRVSLTGPARQRPEPVGVVHGQMEAIVALGQRLPLVVFFDEFSGIAGIDGAAGLLRTHLQHHYQDIGLIFAGSEPSMMTSLFSDQTQPFYSQAQIIQMVPFTRAEVIDIVTGGFTRSGRAAGPLPARIGRFSGGHPQRAMQLADVAWRLTPAGEAADDQTWEQVLGGARQEVASGLERLYSSLPGGEKAVLRIVASGGSIFGVAAGLLDLSTGGAQHARQQLIDHGHLRKSDTGSLEVIDPLFADWLRLTVPV